jgi:hypothetical protein
MGSETQEAVFLRASPFFLLQGSKYDRLGEQLSAADYPCSRGGCIR